MSIKYYYIICAAVFVLISGCDHRLDMSQFSGPSKITNTADTSYVEINPPWIGFDTPRSILVGRDNLIYIADYGANEVVMLDGGGAVLGRRHVLHPMALAQDSRLDLYITGETVAPNGIDTIGVLYRLYMVRYDSVWFEHRDTVLGTGQHIDIVTRHVDQHFYNHDIANATMHAVVQEAAHPARRFTGIAIRPGNSYLLARDGPNNVSSRDPDTQLLEYNSGDTLLTPVPDLQTRASEGSAITDITNLTSIFMFPNSNDFIVTQAGTNAPYGAIWMVFTSSIDFIGWTPKFNPAREDQRGTDFIRANRFLGAQGVAYDTRRREIFVLDAARDSVMKFTARGQFKSESFGSVYTSQGSLPGLNHPMGIAFSNDCILYIADTGNKLIRRFRLSTNTTCF